MNHMLNESNMFNEMGFFQGPLERWEFKIEPRGRNGTIYAVLECTYEGEQYVLELPMKKIHNDRQEHS